MRCSTCCDGRDQEILQVPIPKVPVVTSAWAAAVLTVAILGCQPETAAAGAVSAATPEAARAGSWVLERGGNAIDAAVAVSFALAVTEPGMSGLGGQTQMIVASEGLTPLAINCSTFAPSALPVGVAWDELAGRRAVAVPTTVRLLDYVHRRFGSGQFAWAELLVPAIRLAADGYPQGPFRHRVLQAIAPKLAAEARPFFLRQRPPAVGEVWRQPRLATTLRQLAERGAEDFYSGDIARVIASDMAAAGGWLTLDDLSGVAEPQEQPSLAAAFGDAVVHAFPPPGGGWVLLQILQTLERDRSQLQYGAPQRLAALARALAAGHAFRSLHPLETDAVRDSAMARIGASRLTLGSSAESGSADPKVQSGETTHFSIVDGDGMMVSATASLNSFFGARTGPANLGFVYNDYLRQFDKDPAHLHAPRPGAAPPSSMTPVVITRGNRPVAALGSPGSQRIISALAQVIELYVGQGWTMEEAVRALRVHASADSRLYVEGRQPPADRVPASFTLHRPLSSLAAEPEGPDPYFGGVHAVYLEEGQWRGTADPRRDGAVALSAAVAPADR